MPIKKYKKGDTIIKQGNPSKMLYKVLSGTVGLYISHGKADELLLDVLTESMCFGESALLADQPSHYTAVALTETTALQVTQEAFPSFIKSDHRNAVQFILSLTKNFSSINMLLNDVRNIGRAGPVSDADFRKLAGKYMATWEEPPEEAPEEAPPEEPTKKLPQKLLPDFPPQEAIPEEAPQAQQAPSAPAEASTPQEEESAPPQAVAPAPEPADEKPAEISWIYLPGHGDYASIRHPEYRAHLFDTDYICPHCRKEFSGSRIFYSDPTLVASQNPASSRYDLRVFYQNFEIEWYEVITCPHCYFSALDSFFSSPKLLAKQRYEDKLTEAYGLIALDFSADRDLNFIMNQHYLALICSHGYSDRRQILAHLWMNLRWLYQSAGDTALAQQAESKALEAYKIVYSESDLSPAQQQHLCLLVAGILFRANDIRGAREWAIKARMNQEGKKAYSQLAEQLIGEIRELLSQ